MAERNDTAYAAFPAGASVAEAVARLEEWSNGNDERVVSMMRGSNTISERAWIVVLYGPQDLSVAKVHPLLPAAVEAALRAAGGGE